MSHFLSKSLYSPRMKAHYKSSILLSSAFILLTLAGCQTVPAQNVSTETQLSEGGAEQVAIPELNIPEPVSEVSCECDSLIGEVEETNFDRGIRALAARDYAQALQYFEAHRDADDTYAAREAEIGVAFIAVLQADSRDPRNSQALDDRAEVMSLALSLLTRLEDKVSLLGKANSRLADDLKKKESVLERLRELTLGQLED